MTLPLVSASKARMAPTRHQLVQGLGYIVHDGPPDLPAGSNGNLNCDPPPGTIPGSAHLLRPPGGHPPIAMLWHAGEQAWLCPQPGRGNRLGWPTAHLRKAGWEYVGPTDDLGAGLAAMLPEPELAAMPKPKKKGRG
jgi:hypothetical protein